VDREILITLHVYAYSSILISRTLIDFNKVFLLKNIKIAASSNIIEYIGTLSFNNVFKEVYRE
jgi:hypothetical protein